MPAWCAFRDDAQREITHNEITKAAMNIAGMRAQEPQYQNSPLTVLGEHEEATIQQMKNCMSVGNVVGGVICADGHLGYAQPVGGVTAYERQISISGVGFDIGCGNMAVRLDVPYSRIAPWTDALLHDIKRTISFGIGRVNDERAEHELFDDDEAWRAADMEGYRNKARQQLGTVGSGNHYVDLMYDEAGFVWIGVHFGSRGLGHTTATKYLKLAGGKDGMHVPPAIVDEDSELGQRYIAAMELAGRYAYAGREWVVERVRRMIGGAVQDTVHNHHNYAWRETHGGRSLWVVRKGATPAFPGQRGFVGGSMGDDAVIIEGVDSEQARAALHSTVHGAGRTFGRQEAKRRFTRQEMDQWLRKRGVRLAGGDLDESPMAYRRLPDVLAHHTDSVNVVHTLRPFAVAMAGSDDFDPFKD
jgi:tRNA-splicing ligase RtcB